MAVFEDGGGWSGENLDESEKKYIFEWMDMETSIQYLPGVGPRRAQLLESGRAALVLLALTVVNLLFPLGNGILHALFVKAARTTSLGSLVLGYLIGIGALFVLGGTFLHRLALGKQILSFFCFILTRI